MESVPRAPRPTTHDSRLPLHGPLRPSTGYLESLPISVRTRLNYLENLQEDYDKAEDAVNEEIKALEK